jgi:hypothetical protein
MTEYKFGTMVTRKLAGENSETTCPTVTLPIQLPYGLPRD